MAQQRVGFDSKKSTKKGKKTRQGHGRGTKYSTRVNSKRFKKKRRGQGKQYLTFTIKIVILIINIRGYNAKD